jgi:hypothetical protein
MIKVANILVLGGAGALRCAGRCAGQFGDLKRKPAHCRGAERLRLRTVATAMLRATRVLNHPSNDAWVGTKALRVRANELASQAVVGTERHQNNTAAARK